MKDWPILWISTRAAGLVALGALTASMVIGLVIKTRMFGRSVKAISGVELHRSLTTASLVAVALHGVLLTFDTTIDIGWSDLVIPGTLPYKPVWTGAGVIAAELMIIVALSFRLRRHIGMAVWRRLHYATYAIFILAMAHGIGAGSSTANSWMPWVYVASISLVCGATVFRVVSPLPPSQEIAARPRSHSSPAMRPASHSEDGGSQRRPGEAPAGAQRINGARGPELRPTRPAVGNSARSGQQPSPRPRPASARPGAPTR